jgi:hypothetical protein
MQNVSAVSLDMCPFSNFVVALYVLSQHYISADGQGYSVRGPRTETQAIIVPSGKLVVLHRLLQDSSNAYRSESLVFKKISLMLGWGVTTP